ncbi:MAG: VWA domain-containing protein [Streptosporangiaceae bacterium]
MPDAESTLTALVDELRAVGVGVSVGEHLDAARALASIPLADLDVVRASLQCVMVKRAEHLDAFNVLFNLHFAGTRPSDPGPFAGLADAELAAALRAAIRSGDPVALRQLADEYVRRFAALEPGAPVAGVFAMIAASEAADLDGIRAELLASMAGQQGGGEGEGSGGGGGSGGGWSARGSAALRERLDRGAADRAVDRFRDELQAAIRRALVADRGPRAVSKTMRVRLAEDIDIATASAAELDSMVSSIGPLAHQLSKILAQQEYRKRRLSVRRTLHLAMGTGGVPFRIATEPAPPPKPEIVVLCDVSGSVATFSRFTLNLLIALDSRLSRLRAFSFVDGLSEITELVSEARSAGRQLAQAEAARGAIRWNGSSDYGHVLRDFARDYSRQFSRRTVVLVVGDARTNYLNPAAEALAEVSDRVGKLYWLNPEPRRYWNQGDSVMATYAPLCSQVRECSTLRQIADFVTSLAVR